MNVSMSEAELPSYLQASLCAATIYICGDFLLIFLKSCYVTLELSVLIVF